MHISTIFQKKIVDTGKCTSYIIVMIELPVEYQHAVGQIVELTARTEHLHGSKREKWLTFNLFEYEITLDRFKHYGIKNYIVYEITHPEFFILYEETWPTTNTHWLWNNQLMSPNSFQNPRYPGYTTSGNVTALYTGDLNAIYSVAMLMWLTLSV